MSLHDWNSLRIGTKQCSYTKCLRNPRNPQVIDPITPILFSRKEETLDSIQCIIVSQEPGASLRSAYGTDVNLMEEKLRENCLGWSWKGESQIKVTEKGTSPVNLMIGIFGQFDLHSGPIYWTHALKCVPINDLSIRSQWKTCAPFCVNHLKDEIAAIPTKEIALVSVGSYALAICRHLLFGDNLAPQKITSYLRKLDDLNPTEYINKNAKKTIIFTSFLHPSNRNRILSVHDKDGIIAENEQRQKNFLKDFIRK